MPESTGIDPWDLVWFGIGFMTFFLVVPMRGGMLWRWINRKG